MPHCHAFTYLRARLLGGEYEHRGAASSPLCPTAMCVQFDLCRVVYVCATVFVVPKKSQMWATERTVAQFAKAHWQDLALRCRSCGLEESAQCAPPGRWKITMITETPTHLAVRTAHCGTRLSSHSRLSGPALNASHRTPEPRPSSYRALSYGLSPRPQDSHFASGTVNGLDIHYIRQASTRDGIHVSTAPGRRRREAARQALAAGQCPATSTTARLHAVADDLQTTL